MTGEKQNLDAKWLVVIILGAVNVYIDLDYHEVAPYAYQQGHRGWFNLIIGIGLVIYGLVRLVW